IYQHVSCLSQGPAGASLSGCQERVTAACDSRPVDAPKRPPMPLDALISTFVTLLLVVDPIGLAPTFLAVTEGIPAKARRQVAARASIIGVAILTGAAIGGDWLVRTVGISMPAFRIAGGLLLFSIASEMVFGVRIERQSRAAEQALEEHVRNVAAFPLAFPLMAGPGAITATVLLAGRTGGNLVAFAMLLGVICAVL